MKDLKTNRRTFIMGLGAFLAPVGATLASAAEALTPSNQPVPQFAARVDAPLNRENDYDLMMRQETAWMNDFRNTGRLSL